MKAQKYFIGMDGGGTKTHAIIATTHGDIIAEHIGGPSNFQIIGVEKAAKTIFQLVQSCCESADCLIKEIETLSVGLAGAGRVGDQERMKAGIKKFAASKKLELKNIIVESDARIALEGAFKGDPGIILIAGTGSIAFGKDAKGKIHRVGGWGRLLGDEGGGYFIGQKGLTAVGLAIDGRGVKTKLSGMIARQFGLKDQTAIINAVYKNNFDLASVAPLVLKAAERNDQVCRLIIDNVTIELAAHVKVMERKISSSSHARIKSKIHLSFIGGLIANETLLARNLTGYIVANFPTIEIIQPMATPAFGAVVLAMNER
jgi:N-acetylglucosamine kinase-like BadF-type ATPase